MDQDRRLIELVDCTLRDGSYQVDFGFTAADTTSLVGALEKAGVGWIEAGHGLGMGAPASGKVQSAETDEAYLTAARAGAKIAKVGVFAMPAFAGLSDIAKVADHGLDFIRIGIDAAKYREAEPYVREAVRRGLHTTVFLMKSYSLPHAELAANAPLFADWGAKAVAIVDSAGGMVPNEVAAYVGAVRERTGLEVVFHGHNNLQLACANALAAAKAGASVLDASLKGMGRSSGNAQIEALAAALDRSGYTVSADPLLLCDVAARFITRPDTHSGVEAVDLVQGMAKVHSGMQQRIDWAAAVFHLDPAILTLAVGEAGGGLDMSQDDVLSIAGKLSVGRTRRAIH